jgi:integrase
MKKRYEREWARWETWASSHGHSPLPAETAHVAEYAMGLLALGAAPSGVGMVLSSIRWRHRIANADPPPDNERIPATSSAPSEGEPITQADAAALIEVTSLRRSYRVGRGVRRERQSRTNKRAVIDSVIIGLVWETLATAGEIAGLEWADVDLDRRRVLYAERDGWSPVSEGLAHRLTLLAEFRNATTSVVGLSPASVRRRVREAAEYGDLGSGWSLRRLRTGAVRAIAAHGASMADVTRAGVSPPGTAGQAEGEATGVGEGLAAHLQDSPVPKPD